MTMPSYLGTVLYSILRGWHVLVGTAVLHHRGDEYLGTVHEHDRWLRT